MLKAVVFDLDDTLYPEEQFILSGFCQVAEHLGRKGLVANDFFHHLEQVYRKGVRGKIFDEALTLVGIKPGLQLIQEMLHVYRSHTPNIKLFPDAGEILSMLSAKFVLGLLSDGYLGVQINKFEALGIRHYFHAVVFSDRFGREYWKPNPKPYQAVLDQLGIAPDEALYVADNPAKDFITPRKMGWWTVQVKQPNGQYRNLIPQPGYQAHFEIASLLEIPGLPIDSLKGLL